MFNKVIDKNNLIYTIYADGFVNHAISERGNRNSICQGRIDNDISKLKSYILSQFRISSHNTRKVFEAPSYQNGSTRSWDASDAIAAAKLIGKFDGPFEKWVASKSSGGVTANLYHNVAVYTNEIGAIRYYAQDRIEAIALAIALKDADSLKKVIAVAYEAGKGYTALKTELLHIG